MGVNSLEGEVRLRFGIVNMHSFAAHPAQVKSALGCKNAWRFGRRGTRSPIPFIFRTTCPRLEEMEAADSNIC